MKKQVKKSSAKTTAKEIESGKGMAILSYILAFIPYFTEKKNRFVRYHAVQGMNILLVALIWSAVTGIINNIIYDATLTQCVFSWGANCHSWGFLNILSAFFSIVSFAIFALDIIGLVFAAAGQEKEVPLLGKIRIIKK